MQLYRLLLFLLLPFTSIAQNTQHSNEMFRDTEQNRMFSDSLMNEAINISSRSVDSTLLFLDELIANYRLQGFDYGYARAISLKGWFLNFQTKYEEGLTLGHEALKIQKQLGDSLGIGKTLNRLGLSNIYFQREKEAHKYLGQALIYFKALNDTLQIDQVLNNLGVLSIELEEYEKGIDYYSQSLELRKIKKKYFWEAYSYYNIAEAFSYLNEKDSVEKYFDLALFTFKNKSEAGKVPAMIYYGIANWNITSMDYEKAIKNGHIALEKAIAKNNKEMTFAVTTALVEGYSGLGNYKKAFEYQTEAFEQGQRIDSLNNGVKIAEIEEKYNSAENQRQIVELENKDLENTNKINGLMSILIYYALTILAGGALLSVLLIRKKQKRAIQKETLEKNLAEIKLMALQSQMNPHFIFNCINTAQSFVLNDKKQEAYIYLSNFAKLLRSVLIHSSKTYIPLEDEVAQLRIYIELEAIRFDENFDYEIHIDPALENGVYEVPGMILQSFVENAILHGINNLKDKHGHLSLNFQMQGDLLKCEIRDNGIGRKAAQAIKESKSAHYPSAALPNISERIEILREITDRKVEISIEDLSENGVATGTNVVLYLPIQ